MTPPCETLEHVKLIKEEVPFGDVTRRHSGEQTAQKERPGYANTLRAS